MLNINPKVTVPFVALALLGTSSLAGDAESLPAGTCLASRLVGAGVSDTAHEKHAEIIDLMVDCSNERVACAIVRCEDVDERDFAVPLSELRFTTNEDGDQVVTLSREALASQKSFAAGEFELVSNLDIDGVSRTTRLHRASEVRGTAIENSAGESLGEIDDIVVNLNDGDVPFAVVAIGGFLGIGEDRHPVPVNAFRAPSGEPESDTLVLDIPKERLESAPHFPRGQYPNPTDEAYITKLRDHYRGEFGDGIAFATGATTSRVSQMLGMKVVGASDEKIGSIDDLVLDESSGKVEYAVISCGGFLGIGDKLVFVPRESLTHSADGESCRLDVTKETLETAVEYNDEFVSKLSDPACCASIGRPFMVRETGATGIRPVMASKLIESNIRSTADGEALGQMEDLAIDPSSGEIRYAVILLEEADDELFAIRWNELQPSPSSDGVKLDVDRVTVMNERGFPKNHWPSERKQSDKN